MRHEFINNVAKHINDFENTNNTHIQHNSTLFWSLKQKGKTIQKAADQTRECLQKKYFMFSFIIISSQVDSL